MRAMYNKTAINMTNTDSTTSKITKCKLPKYTN